MTPEKLAELKQKSEYPSTQQFWVGDFVNGWTLTELPALVVIAQQDLKDLLDDEEEAAQWRSRMSDNFIRLDALFVKTWEEGVRVTLNNDALSRQVSVLADEIANLEQHLQEALTEALTASASVLTLRGALWDKDAEIEGLKDVLARVWGEWKDSPNATDPEAEGYETLQMVRQALKEAE